MHEVFEEEVLDGFRKIFFPPIRLKLLSGYNVYRNRQADSAPYTVHYLHSDLNISESGERDTHLDELVLQLDQHGHPIVSEQLIHSLVARMAVYRMGEWEENPVGLHFYDLEGRHLDVTSLKSYSDPVVIEGKQYDLGLEVRSSTDLRNVLKIFRDYAYAYLLDPQGDITDRPNPKAGSGAWKIPLLVVSTERRPRLRDFCPITDIETNITEYAGSTLVVNARTLQDHFAQRKILVSTTLRFVNEVFVNSYLKALS